jgi:hypothetical protein
VRYPAHFAIKIAHAGIEVTGYIRKAIFIHRGEPETEKV